ncbi:MAG TPA: major capsid protein [Planctomycetota bacterium]|nr:major capsid protein [Planctomycetota bacterium]
MPYSVISNYTFDPQLASEYSSAAFVENMQLLDQALGVVKTLSAGDYGSSLGGGGQFIDLPYFANIGSLVSRRDLASTSAPGDLDITGSSDKAVILRRKAGPVKFTEDLFIRGLRRESVEQEVGRQIGNMAAVEVRARLLQVAIAALDSLDTPSADFHINNVYVPTGTKVKLTLQSLYDTRMKLGDAYNRLTTVVCHSEAFADLVSDHMANYKVENVGGYTVVTGLAQAFGMKIVVVDDAALKETNGGNYKRYRTLLFGPGAMGLIYHQRLRIEAERRLDFEAPYWRVLANFDFAPHMFGMKWTSATANPDNTALGTAANWDEAYNDHREVLCAELVHNATAA